MYEYFDHTADVGISVATADLPALYEEAARALFSLIVEDLTSVRPDRSVSLRVEGTDPEYLLFDWLCELLHVFDTERLVLSQIEVSLKPDGLVAVAAGETLDPRRHQLAHEVKAITYHRLQVEQTGEGWRAQVIVDI